LASFVALGLSGCSWAPIKNVTSLSPAIQADTLGYNEAIGDSADQILLGNILRSRDFEPLNLSQLSSLSGALTLQGSLSLSLPAGEGAGSNAPVIGQNVTTPGITASTSPTYTVTPLNTQAFTLSILQPVSAGYVLNRWQAGLPRELLLLLFVKEIDFPDPSTAPENAGNTVRYYNNPDNEQQFAAFRDLIDTLILAHAELKSVDVLDPVGPPFSLNASIATTIPEPAHDGFAATNKTTSTLKTTADSAGFGLITGSNDGQYHVGNTPLPADLPIHGPDYTTDDSNKPQTRGGQLYRVYAGQVELCIQPDRLRLPNRILPPRSFYRPFRHLLPPYPLLLPSPRRQPGPRLRQKCRHTRGTGRKKIG